MSIATSDAQHWRDCADQARALAETMSDPGARQTLFDVAAAYDAMAVRAERKRAAQSPAAAPGIAAPPTRER